MTGLLLALFFALLFSAHNGAALRSGRQHSAFSVQADDDDSSNSPQPKTLDFTCNTAPLTPQDRRTDTSTLSVLEFNAEWLFVGGGSGALRCPGASCPWKDLAAARAHLQRIAERIAANGFPDIIHLAEVEDCGVLRELLAALDALHPQKSAGYRPYLAKGTDTALGQQVALLTRIDPVVDVQRTEARAEFPIAGSRCGFKGKNGATRTCGVSKHYYTRLRVNGRMLNLVGVHLVAFPNIKERCARREAQASVLKSLIREIHDADRHDLIVLGDFNDYDPDVTDAAGDIDTPLSQALPIIKRATVPALRNLAQSWGARVERFSSWFDRNRNCVDDNGAEHSLIDHILVSGELHQKLAETRPFHNYTAFCGKIDSDHWPLYARFNV